MKYYNVIGFIVGVFILFTIGCQQIQNQMRVEPNNGEQNEKQYWGDVIIGDVDDKFGTDIGFWINAATITGDTLTLNLRFSNCGPQNENFTLEVSESFIESFPVQLKVLLRHSRIGPCDVLLTEDFHFDLTPIKTMYQKAYQQQAGTIILRLNKYTVFQPPMEDLELVYEFTM